MSQAVHSPCWIWRVRLVEGAVCSAWAKYAALESFVGSLSHADEDGNDTKSES